MFETSGTVDVIEKSYGYKYVLWFVAGCVATALFFTVFVMPHAKRVVLAAAETAAEQKFSADLAKDPLDAQVESTKAGLLAASQERDACKAKFDRQTILYDNSIVVDPTKIWIIPADVEPTAVGDARVTFTHYDPKTKRETVHFHPQRQ